jgi:TonB family protein
LTVFVGERHVASATSASRSPDAAAPAAASGQPATRPAADITAVTTHDDFLLELGQTLGGQAAVRPVDTLEAALECMANSKRGQVLAIDARDVRNVRAAVDTATAKAPRAVVLVFAEGAAEKQLGAALKGSKVFAVLPTPIDARKTQAVVEGAIADAVANKAAASAAQAAPPLPAAGPDLTIGAFRPAAAPAPVRSARGTPRRWLLPAIAAAAVALAAAGGAWWYLTRGAAPAPAPARAKPVMPPAAAPADNAVTAPAADTSIVQGKVDELLEKARLAMHERRFTEPAGDNALLYYRSAVAADGRNAEARDGLGRVAAVLAGRFDEALSGGRFDEAALTLANFKAATPADPRVGAFELKLYSAQITKALTDGNLDRASALVRQAQQSSSIPAEQIARWRSDVSHRQEDAKVQRLAGLVDDRIHDGRLVDADDSAKSYLQQLLAAAPGNPSTQRATHELSAAYLHKAREAALAKSNVEEERWLGEARAIGLKPAEVAAFEREVAGARQKATQAESERLVQTARERLRDGRLTDPPQDSAAYYLTQAQSTDPAATSVADAGRELAQQLLARARAAIGAGKSADADIALAKRWGADPQELLAVQQLQSQPKAGAATDLAALAANLKRVRATPPDYPQSALNKRITGSVTLEYTVDTHGEPRDVHVIEASPPGVFDQAAISAVKHWRYAPMIVNGSAVEVPVKAHVRFELPK